MSDVPSSLLRRELAGRVQRILGALYGLRGLRIIRDNTMRGVEGFLAGDGSKIIVSEQWNIGCGCHISWMFIAC